MLAEKSYPIKLYVCGDFSPVRPRRATLFVREKELKVVCPESEGGEWVIPFTAFTRVMKEFPSFLACLHDGVNVLSFSCFGHTRELSRILQRGMGKTPLEDFYNYDFGMRCFFYRIAMRKDALAETLAVRDVYDEMDYLFDEEALRLTFYAFGRKLSYQMEIEEYDKFCVLRLFQVRGMPNRISLHINGFMREKLDAEPVAYGGY